MLDISVVYFTKDVGGMHNYANLINEGYQANNYNSKICNKYLWGINYYLEIIKLIFFKEASIIEWWKGTICSNSRVIHFTDTPIYIIPLLQKIYDKNKLYIITIHDPDPHPEKKILKKIKWVMMLMLNKQIVSISNKYENIYIHLHSKVQIPKKSKNNIVAFHPISDIYKDYRVITSVHDSKCLNFLFIGRLEYYKGVDIYLRAAQKMMLLNCDNIKFFLTGSGEVYPESLTTGVQCQYGYISDELFIDQIKSSHVVVLPYRQATQSGVLNLAISLNKPVIISDVGCLSEYVVHNETGIIIDDLDEKKLIDAFCFFDNNRESVQVMSQNICKYKYNFFSGGVVASMIEKQMSLFQKYLGL